MTRKRFVKLLMARGRSRNEANQAALAAVCDGHTYDGIYFAVRVNDGDTEAVEAVRAACTRMAEVFTEWTNAMCEAVEKITAAIPSLQEMLQKRKDQQEASTE